MLDLIAISLGLLTIAVMIMRYTAQLEDVLHGRYITESDIDTSSRLSPERHAQLTELYRVLSSIPAEQASTAFGREQAPADQERELQNYHSRFANSDLTPRRQNSVFAGAPLAQQAVRSL